MNRDELSLTGADFRAALADLHGQAVADRRHLHRHPELSGVEHETTRFLRERLEALGIRILDFPGPGVVAQVDAPDPDSPVIALRADIDALPVAENDDKPVVSANPGVSHACGHDGHMAILLAVAAWVATHADRLTTSVRLLFQSSEEQIPSGAERLVRCGAIDGVAHIFGLHLWQHLDTGLVGTVEGPMMASTDDFDITFSGPGGHGGMPHDSADVVVAAARLITDLQAVAARRQDPQRPLVITVGHVEAPGNHNVIPSRALLQGTVRALDHASRDDAERWIADAARAAAELSGAEVAIMHQRGTPPLINDASAARFLHRVVGRHSSTAEPACITPVMGGEDFSFYLERIPGAFAFLGMGGPASQHAHHTPSFDIDEDVLRTGIEVFVGVVDDYADDHREDGR